MPQTRAQLTREEIAKIEIGHTEIGRRTAMVLVAVLLATTFAVPAVQHLCEILRLHGGNPGSRVPQCYSILGSVPRAATVLGNANGSAWGRVLAADRSMLRDINEFERTLEDESVFARIALPPAQELFVRAGLGNEKAYCGVDGWLFYRPGIDYLTGPGFLTTKHMRKRIASAKEWEEPPQPDPRPAIIRFHRQLAQRGIVLVVVPTPGKATVHPEKFSRAGANAAAPLQNASYPQFLRELQTEGIAVFDPAPILVERKLQTGQPQYLETDTHWRPEAMEAVAAYLARFIASRVKLPPIPPFPLKAEPREATNLGDIALMLKLPPDQAIYPRQRVTIRQVSCDHSGRTQSGTFWHPSKAADVLLLGDSFSNVYSLEPMGWGESAGLAEHISLALGRLLDCITRNDSGAYATRQMLSRELALGRDRLAGKHVVIWQFAARELLVGDWKLLDLTVGTRPPPSFLVPEPGSTMAVSGTIESISAAPRPGSVPYKDHIVAMHLVDLENGLGAIPGAQAMVYTWSMRDNVWTPAARYRPGTRLTLKIRPWSDVAEKLDRINRAELDDEELQLEEPCWSE